MGREIDPVRLVTPDERTPGPVTPGMDRQQVYVVTGWLRMEFGPGGSEVVEAGPGDFVLNVGGPAPVV